MRAWYYDDLPGHQRLPHKGESVSNQKVYDMGIKHWRIPLEKHEEILNQIAIERDYPNRDVMCLSKEGLGLIYEEKMVYFFQEHMHEDEEIRFVVDGSAYYDIRETPTERWIRFQIEPQDLVVIPVGIYHRFTLDEEGYIKSIRLFGSDPKWVYLYRSKELEVNPYRMEYLRETKEWLGLREGEDGHGPRGWGLWIWSWVTWITPWQKLSL
ncbi:Fe-ARD 2 [Coprinopsis marcescibilis]|uniref:Acireductone dioxygenase n=1 Tax=Coprinopsis marcescibilis TaxID=230819 RepID=A0A5C3KXJ5_COPMA|nr:Fe-ARD 2 [Coprinopsis marcescibilis]